jgi:hypothetical protein
MNLASMSLAEIKAARPDLAAELLKEARENDASEAELKTLREANQAFKLAEEKRTHEASLATKKTALREQCVKAKVPDGLISDLFIESLMSLDETKTAELIEDRKARATGPMPKSKAGDPAARIASGAPALTTSKLTESLNGR